MFVILYCGYKTLLININLSKTQRINAYNSILYIDRRILVYLTFCFNKIINLQIKRNKFDLF